MTERPVLFSDIRKKQPGFGSSRKSVAVKIALRIRITLHPAPLQCSNECLVKVDDIFSAFR